MLEPAMTTPTPWTDEMLMAFADGEVAPTEAAAIATAAAADPALAARIDAFRQSRARIAVLATDTAVPDALVARIRALQAAEAATPAPANSNVIPLTPRPRAPLWQLPLAASVALLAGLAVGAFMPRGDVPATPVALLSAPGLPEALASLPSGQSATLPDGSALTLISSFETETGDLCREIELAAPDSAILVAVTCRTGGLWDTQLAVLAEGGASGYTPAASLDTLDAWYAATGASAPLSPEEEAARLTP
jgi:anti-sigma factor RsiW